MAILKDVSGEDNFNAATTTGLTTGSSTSTTTTSTAVQFNSSEQQQTCDNSSSKVVKVQQQQQQPKLVNKANSGSSKKSSSRKKTAYHPILPALPAVTGSASAAPTTNAPEVDLYFHSAASNVSPDSGIQSEGGNGGHMTNSSPMSSSETTTAPPTIPTIYTNYPTATGATSGSGLYSPTSGLYQPWTAATTGSASATANATTQWTTNPPTATLTTADWSTQVVYNATNIIGKRLCLHFAR